MPNNSSISIVVSAQLFGVALCNHVECCTTLYGAIGT